MNNRIEIAREFADAIKSDKIVKIILFGPVARGDDSEYSDIYFNCFRLLGRNRFHNYGCSWRYCF